MDLLDIKTKIKEDMKSLGCNSEKKIALAYHLYVYLVDKKLMYDTEYCYNKDIDTLYVVARPNKTEKLNIYVPVPTSDKLSMDLINNLQVNLCTVETGPVINLAIIDGDFTTVIYSISKGLAPCPSQDAIQQRRVKEEKRNYINRELERNKEEILNNALNGGFVDDDDCEILE